MRTPVPFRTAFPLLAVLFATAFGAHAQVPTSLSTQTVVLNQLPSEAAGPLTLAAALDLALRANPDITVALREREASEGTVIQGRARPNPSIEFLVEDTRTTTRTTTVQINQPIELAGKRSARIAIAERGRIDKNWIKRLPDNSAPYTSTIVFLVRKGNPKHIKDWNDLTKEGVEIITPNPKTGGAPRWIYLSAWGYALKQPGGNDAKARDLVKKLYQNVKVLDSGARGSLTTFAERGIGDVLLSWENEALLATQGLGKDKYDIVYPSISILAEPSVAIVDKTVDKNGNRQLARGYLNFLYSPLGQELAAKHYFRPRNPQVAAKYAAQFPKIKLFSINDVFGGWAKAQKTHFVNGAVFDQIYTEKQ